MRLSLLHKGLILVAIPLCFELAIFSTLLSLQNDMAQEAARIDKARQIADTVNKVTHRLVLMENAEHLHSPAQALKEIRVHSDMMFKYFDTLETLTAGNTTPGYTDAPKIINKSRQALTAALRVVDEIRAYLASNNTDPNSAFANMDTKEAARVFRVKFNVHLKAFVESGIYEMAANSAREIDTDKTSEMRAKTIFLIKCAVALSALIGIIGALTYSRHLIKRLEVVVQNAGKLGARKPLSKAIGGNDEISDLDRAMHQAADTIAHLERAREEIIGMVSHDIRSPITTIKCTSEALDIKLEESLDERDKQLLKTIDNNCDRILRISRDLLDMQKLDAGMLTIQSEKMNLKVCVEAAIESVQGLLGNRQLTIETKLQDLDAFGEEGRIEQVVTNFLSNAIKHSPRKSAIQVELYRASDVKFAYISVTDKGPGIPPDMQSIIFERFQQLDDEQASRGTGLGLAICKALIELHGGKIGVENVEPHGSKFWIKLPIIS